MNEAKPLVKHIKRKGPLCSLCELFCSFPIYIYIYFLLHLFVIFLISSKPYIYIYKYIFGLEILVENPQNMVGKVDSLTEEAERPEYDGQRAAPLKGGGQSQEHSWTGRSYC